MIFWAILTLFDAGNIQGDQAMVVWDKLSILGQCTTTIRYWPNHRGHPVVLKAIYTGILFNLTLGRYVGLFFTPIELPPRPASRRVFTSPCWRCPGAAPSRYSTPCSSRGRWTRSSWRPSCTSSGSAPRRRSRRRPSGAAAASRGRRSRSPCPAAE